MLRLQARENRTYVELKYLCYLKRTYAPQSENRTYVELKLQECSYRA